MVIGALDRSRLPALDRPMSGRPRVLAAWLTEQAGPIDAPLAVTRTGLGYTNATWLVTDQARRQWILRERTRPDSRSFDREAAVLTRLSAMGLPVPRVTGHGDQRGCHFMVTSVAAGVVIDDELQASRLTVDERRRLGENVVDALARLHTVDPASVGLPEFGARHMDRQLAVLADVWTSSGSSSVHDSAWCAVRTRLLARRPDREPRIRLVHGDYRLANIVTQDAKVVAVLDWERCTAGNPLSDLAWLLNSWRGPDEPTGCPNSPTLVGGFPSREELLDFYAARTGIELHNLNYQRALAYWTSATLLQAAETRRRTDVSQADLGNVDEEINYCLIEAASLLRNHRW